MAADTTGLYLSVANISSVKAQEMTFGNCDNFGVDTTGINVTAGTSDYLLFNDNNMAGSTTTMTLGALSGTHNRIVGNPPYNPVGTTAAANVGASPATITAGPSPETHYIKQSASFNAVVAKNGQTICGDTVAAVPCVVDLGPNESYVVTWTTTQPTYTKDVH